MPRGKSDKPRVRRHPIAKSAAELLKSRSAMEKLSEKYTVAQTAETAAVASLRLALNIDGLDWTGTLVNRVGGFVIFLTKNELGEISIDVTREHGAGPEDEDEDEFEDDEADDEVDLLSGHEAEESALEPVNEVDEASRAAQAVA